MKANKKIILLRSSLLLMLLLSSCSQPQGQMDVSVPSKSAARLSSTDILTSEPSLRTEGEIDSPKPKQQSQPQQIVKRFQEPVIQGQSALESAIELSHKYASLSNETAGLRQQNQNLIDDNRQLKEQIGTLETKLKQTQKELNEANNLLIEMRIELNSWKTDILGFRDEIRQAESAQLEALLKILKMLGGEVTTESSQTDNGSSTEAGTAQAESDDTSGKDKSNE
jgi:chromosome segregation ATPase